MHSSLHRELSNHFDDHRNELLARLKHPFWGGDEDCQVATNSTARGKSPSLEDASPKARPTAPQLLGLSPAPQPLGRSPQPLDPNGPKVLQEDFAEFIGGFLGREVS